jgi:sensor domain CHASE-containing protein
MKDLGQIFDEMASIDQRQAVLYAEISEREGERVCLTERYASLAEEFRAWKDTELRRRRDATSTSDGDGTVANGPVAAASAS